MAIFRPRSASISGRRRASRSWPSKTTWPRVISAERGSRRKIERPVTVLPPAGFAHQTKHFAGAHVERDAVERFQATARGLNSR